MTNRDTHYYQVIGVIKTTKRPIFRAFGRFPDVATMRAAAEDWARNTAGACAYIMKRRRWREPPEGRGVLRHPRPKL